MSKIKEGNYCIYQNSLSLVLDASDISGSEYARVTQGSEYFSGSEFVMVTQGYNCQNNF